MCEKTVNSDPFCSLKGCSCFCLFLSPSLQSILIYRTLILTGHFTLRSILFIVKNKSLKGKNSVLFCFCSVSFITIRQYCDNNYNTAISSDFMLAKSGLSIPRRSLSMVISSFNACTCVCVYECVPDLFIGSSGMHVCVCVSHQSLYQCACTRTAHLTLQSSNLVKPLERFCCAAPQDLLIASQKARLPNVHSDGQEICWL